MTAATQAGLAGQGIAKAECPGQQPARGNAAGSRQGALR
jgi:hypothetical protein